MAIITKKAIDLTGLSQEQLDTWADLSDEEKLKLSGISGDKRLEPVPDFVRTPSEKVIKNDNNSWIVLGRDRVGNSATGYGGLGNTQAASIDIVVGRMAPSPIAVDENGSKMSVDPIFNVEDDPRYGKLTDAARIYISQKTDIDMAFNLAAGRVGSPGFEVNPRSAVALKADGIRIIAREGIKLVTGTDSINSQGGTVIAKTGVDIIAGNDDTELQPIVKGDNLVAALLEITNLLDNTIGFTHKFLLSQMEMNIALAYHFHASPFFAAPTTPSPIVSAVAMKALIDQLVKVQTSMMFTKFNLAGFRTQFLSIAGPNYINSKFNNVN